MTTLARTEWEKYAAEMKIGKLPPDIIDYMKLCIISLCCICLGFAVQEKLQPTVEDLEYRAAVAWNQGDLELAERLSRSTMGRHPKSARAREILQRLSDPLGRPEIELALVLPERDEPYRQEQLAEAGRIALKNHLFRLADDYVSQGVRLFPRNAALQSQYVSLSGLRLDADEMQRRLIEWGQTSPPTADLVLMSLGLSSIDSRAASAAELWLKAAVEADVSDIESRLGLARCLIVMGRYQECAYLLTPYESDPKAAVLLAVASASEKNGTAAEILTFSEPVEMKADFWYAKGLVAVEQHDWSSAELYFRNAVQHRPLSQTFRSRHCEVLRRLNDSATQFTQTSLLETVIRIVEKSSETTQSRDPEALVQLAEMCTSVGAEDAAQLVLMVAGSVSENP